VNSFDQIILVWLNHFARTSHALDWTVSTLATSNAVKGGLFTVVLLWFWFGESGGQRRNREIIVATAAAASVAIISGRLLAYALPFRIRPVHNVDLAFVAPYGYPEGLLRGWSAFPSDHAMLFVAMATGFWFLSRRLGLAALVYVGVVILLPRVYLGMHHPSDVVAGALLGAAFALFANLEPVRARLARLPLRWATVHPRSFYAAGFVAAMQVATMFEAPREVVREVVALIRARAPACPPGQSCPGTTAPSDAAVRVLPAGPFLVDRAGDPVPAAGAAPRHQEAGPGQGAASAPAPEERRARRVPARDGAR
jgi:undecaprenyl-diphosphatase